MTPSGTIRARAARGLGCAVVLVLLLIVVRDYLLVEWKYHKGVLAHPRAFLRNALSHESAGGGAALEGEAALASADAPPAGWSALSVSHYSNGRAVYTSDPSAELTWPTTLPAGRYRVTLHAWAYKRGVVNRVAIEAGPERCELSWAPSDPELFARPSAHLRLATEVDRVTLRAATIGQPYLVVDRVVFRRLSDSPWAAFAARAWRIYLPSIGSALLVVLTGTAWGSAVVARLIGRRTDWLEGLVLAAAIGLALIATATTVLGIVGGAYPWVLVALCLAGLVVGGRDLGRLLRAAWAARRHAGPGTWAALAAGAVVGLWMLVRSLSPAAGVDPQIYHLPIAKWLLREGRFAYHPYQLAWGYPHLVSNLFAAAQAFYDEPYFRPAKLTHLALGLLWLGTVFATGRRLFGARTGWAGVVLCLGVEGIVFELGEALVDLGFAFFASASILAAVCAVQGDPRRRGRYMIAAALIAGAAAVCKVQGPAIAMVLGLVLGVHAALRVNWRAGVRSFVLVGVLAAAVAAPMYIKNALVYHNPLHPFYAHVFPSRDLPEGFSQSWQRSASWRVYVLPLGPKRVAMWPYYWVRKGFVDPLSPGPAVLAALGVIALNARRWFGRHWPLWAIILLLVPLWFFISPLTRFALPWVGLLAVYAAAGLSDREAGACSRVVAWLCVLAVVPVIVSGLAGHLTAAQNFVGVESDGDYARRTLRAHANGFAPPLDGIEALNRLAAAAPTDARVLLDTNLSAYADVRTIPVPYWLMLENTWARTWGFVGGGQVCLHRTLKLTSDDAALQELVGRLNVGYVLMGRHPAPEPSDGAYRAAGRPGPSFPESERFDRFMQRCVDRGLARKIVLDDSTLFVLDRDRVLDGPTPASPPAGAGEAPTGRP